MHTSLRVRLYLLETFGCDTGAESAKMDIREAKGARLKPLILLSFVPQIATDSQQPVFISIAVQELLCGYALQT
jgi:hypothetical protein